MVPLLVTNVQWSATRSDKAVSEREIARAVIEEHVTSCLRFERKRECRVARNINALDGVHLDGDGQRHTSSIAAESRGAARCLCKRRPSDRQCGVSSSRLTYHLCASLRDAKRPGSAAAGGRQQQLSDRSARHWHRMRAPVKYTAAQRGRFASAGAYVLIRRRLRRPYAPLPQ